MGTFVINGNKSLFGKIRIDGSKNAALPIIFACITVKGVSRLENVPDIGDVRVAIEILRGFGAKIKRTDDCVTIDTRKLQYSIPNGSLVASIRASSYLLGACVARFGVSEIQKFGGCNFDNRPIDMHIAALSALGASIEGNRLVCKRLISNDIYFKKVSVGATANALIASASAKGTTRIFGYAREPHIIALADFLRNAGATIQLGSECITVKGGDLGDAYVKVIPDMIEAGSYLALSAMGNFDLTVESVLPSHLDSFFVSLANLGVVVEMSENQIKVSGKPNDWVEIETAPYPGFPTDLQPVFASLLARSAGGRITENVWLNRFSYLEELAKFGVCASYESSAAKIYKSELRPAIATAPDLRGGAALVLCALCAEGQSVIHNTEIIMRGYSGLIDKLRSVGADIKEF